MIVNMTPFSAWSNPSQLVTAVIIFMDCSPETVFFNPGIRDRRSRNPVMTTGK